MNHGKRLYVILLTAISLCINSLAASSVNFIQFDDIKPAGFSLDESWNGMGMDHDQNVYIGISHRHVASTYDARDDVALFRYNAKTGQRQFLNTVKGISAAAGNLGPNQHWPQEESIAKIHSPITEYNGKMYFSSHDYHGLESDYSDTINHRGGHFYSYNLTTGQFDDLSKSDPYGVSVRHQGIITMGALKAHNKLAGYTFPWGDILIYDLATRRTTSYPAPAEWRVLGNYCSREIITTNKGKVFFSYNAANAPLYELNAVTGVMKKTSYTLHNGFIPSLIETHEGRMVYFNNMDGYLHAFDTETETLQNLGYCIPDDLLAAGYLPTYVHAGMSLDQTKIYSMVLLWKSSLGIPYSFYEYDIPTGKKRYLGSFNNELDPATLSGSGFADNLGRIYFARFTGEGDCGLVQIALDPKTRISFTTPSNLKMQSHRPSAVWIVDVLGRAISKEMGVPSSPILLKRSGSRPNQTSKLVLFK